MEDKNYLIDCKKRCIELKKEIFCSRYNPQKSEERALSSGISSAVRLLKVYNKNLAFKREEIHNYWKDQLKSLGECYIEIKDRNH